MTGYKILADRIFAMFALGAIGDALGAPVETMSAEEIFARYGRLISFAERGEHKWGPLKKGETTDDTQLKLAIARSIARMGEIDIDDLAREHVLEMEKTTRGWGGSTREAVKRLERGVHWSVSGSTPEGEGGKRGKGNGVAMKIDPVGAYYALHEETDPLHTVLTRVPIIQLARMTHATAMGVASGFAHATAIYNLLTNTVVRTGRFSSHVVYAAKLGERAFPRTPDTHRLSERFQLLDSVTPQTTDETLRVTFGNGDCYVYKSLPLAYALFLRKPHSIEALYDAVNFGGDTDTVGSIVGSLLGAYNGSSIIPQELWAGVDRKAEIEQAVDEFVRAVML